MKFSESWLREWVNPSLDTNALCEQLSMAGLEVDGIEPVAGEFSGVVIGEVTECGQHPDADKLQVTKVNVGDEELLDIVCGAPNCRKGLKVAVAKVGAVLPGNFKIKKAKLRGQPSFGMLCSFSELGMGEDHSGIVELPLDAPVGEDIRDYLSLNDNIIEIDLTPNRADCLGLKGVARDLGVLNQLDVSYPNIPDVATAGNDTRNITLENPDACPRYLGRLIEGVDLTKSSPLWLQEKLRRSGIRSIDPVVDVTNYVLLELGHPMHAFDNDALSGDIVVRMAQKGEKLVLLDETEVTVNTDTLLIADAEKPLALAGIFGGLHSGVTSNTKHVFLESAFFLPDAILGKSRQYGLHTDASHRYERGVDFSLQREAMERATALLQSIVGGKVHNIVEAVSADHLPVREDITLRKSRLDKVLGVTLSNERVTDILTRLGVNPSFNNNEWQVSAPNYRFDIAIEEDLIEEVARVYGYNSIPTQAPVASLNMIPHKEADVSLSSIKSTLLQAGFNEAITYSFVDPKKQNLLFPALEGKLLPHPISADMSAMRVSLLTGLLHALSYNQKRQQLNMKMFETGLVFIPDETEKAGVAQYPVIAGVLSGNTHSEHWNISNTPLDFFDVKGVVEQLLASACDGVEFSFERSKESAFHPGQSANILVDGNKVGIFGAIHPQLEKPLGLNGRTFAFELKLDAILQRKLPWASKISKFPMNRRDLAFSLDETVETGKLLKSIKKIGISELVDINLFDVYQGKGIAEGKKSLAISLWLQSKERTLEDEEIQQAVDNVVSHLEEHFGATLRD
ncbi:phenylalanine--tRNA ligase subunit beta [Agaribacter marinus]|uniref:Phenylalanine--tRNA ligase beta subunit n=1 Tax=Agaribacter marinus TaxID=1431249 RepID=A0AA37SY06_9ALTE|nr:phenylalanine--tRNA ligase subunit beta [Agaribacter marinus]GLR70185.1 phenylalanine--tRNA ligase beta subunit [Agaribacter marinus]